MQIILAIVVLAVFVVIALVSCLCASLLLGGLLSGTKQARILSPVFLAVVPSTAAGALFGGVLLAVIAVRTDENLIVLGPIAGLVAGGLAGFFVGLTIALLWWRRMRDRREQ